mmetsp:Transcript_102363/g.330241  ORF Transcript_102363/g.330241 Transcript_102363/m.330241 type:complete len:640 (+) Transcript_102363:34-1953(+)
MANWWESGAEAQPAGFWSEEGSAAPAAATDATWSADAGAGWPAAAAQADAAGGGGWEAAAGATPEVSSWDAYKSADTSAPTDAWASKGDSWGGGGGGGGGGNPPAREFWDMQKWNKENGTLSRKEEWEWEQEGQRLFDQAGRAQAGQNFSRYDQVPVDLSGSKAENIPTCKTFEEIFTTFKDFMPEALEGNLRRCGYSTPTPVQKFAVPMGLVGRDIMCCAQTGSGKTAAFLIPVIGRMMKTNTNAVGDMTVPFEGICEPSSLVMTPTRELCLQIYEESMKCCHRTPYRVCRVYGGEKPKMQLEELAKGADLIVCTPGRLQDFINREVLSVAKIKILVLDEADRMLDMGFESQIREIVEKHGMLPKDQRQTLMFSATFPDTCQTLAGEFMYDYIWIAVGVIGSAVDTVEQVLERINPAQKYEKLVELLDWFYAERATKTTKDRMLIFTNAKDTARWLDEQLYNKSMDSGALHGDLDQTERETNLRRFRSGEIDILIATDVAARGLDIENVSLVVNYDFPKDIDTYIHRIGRTGRIGNEGKAISYLSTDDSGVCLEPVHMLKDLAGVMTNSKKVIPDWFEGYLETTESSANTKSWSWGAKDVRPDQEAYKASGSGDAWGNWGKADAGKDDSWKQDKQQGW